jgi:hypothetical protein
MGVGEAISSAVGSSSATALRVSTAAAKNTSATVADLGRPLDVGRAADLVRPQRVLWEMGLRCYVEAEVQQPLIVFWEPVPGRPPPEHG